MSERQISVGDWNEQGLLPVEIAERGEGLAQVNLFRFTPEESRQLEQQLHARNAERDE